MSASFMSQMYWRTKSWYMRQVKRKYEIDQVPGISPGVFLAIIFIHDFFKIIRICIAGHIIYSADAG